MGETVTVACKLPHGLRLRLFDMVDASEPVMGGGTRTFKRAQEIGEPVVIRGYRAMPFLEREEGAKFPNGGYALTPGVDKEFWEKWLEQNQDLEAVKNNLVFAAGKTENARAEAVGFVDQLCGLEPMNMTLVPGKKKGTMVAADKRVPRSPAGMTVTTAEDRTPVE